MKLLKGLELIEVKKNAEKTSVDLLFLDYSSLRIHNVRMTIQKYNTESGKFEDNEEKANQVDEWLMKEFGITFNNVEEAIGKTHDIYVYDERERPFNSLWEITSVTKPDENFAKKYRGGVDTIISAIEDTGYRIRLIFDIDGIKYFSSNQVDGSKLSYGDWIESKNKFFPNALKEKQAFETFEKIFGLPFDQKDTLVGTPIRVFPAKAGKNFYIEFEMIRK